jgi:hypothetical protein
MSEKRLLRDVVFLFDARYMMWSRVFWLDRLSQYIWFGVVGSCIIREIGSKKSLRYDSAV